MTAQPSSISPIAIAAREATAIRKFSSSMRPLHMERTAARSTPKPETT